jgi:MFS family permease
MGMILSGSVAGVWSTRIGRYRRFVVGGLGIALIGFALGAAMGPTTPLPVVVASMFVLGIGLGPTNAMFLVAAQAAAPAALLGTTTSAHQFFRQVGGTLGVAAFGALMTLQAGATFDREIAPRVVGLPEAAVASVATPDFLTDPAQAGVAAALVRPAVGADVYRRPGRGVARFAGPQHLVGLPRVGGPDRRGVGRHLAPAAPPARRRRAPRRPAPQLRRRSTVAPSRTSGRPPRNESHPSSPGRASTGASRSATS